jgi:hypothetical protein
MNQQTNINDLPNPAEILSTVSDIKKDLSNLSKNELETKYNSFKNKYEGIYNKVINNDDLSQLFDMLTLLNKVKNGDISLDNATKTVGYQMAHKYIPDDILKDKKPE